jgi:metal-sulfur cluster biosynthetic enzyme
MSENPVALREILLQRLRTVIEPCSILMGNPISILEMGLLERLDHEDGHVRVILCLTDPGCVHFRGMRDYITHALLKVPGVSSVEVSLTTEKLWTPDRTGSAHRIRLERRTPPQSIRAQGS